MRKQKFIQGVAGGHRSKKDYRLQVLQAGTVIFEVKPVTRFQARELAFWWNAISSYGVRIAKHKKQVVSFAYHQKLQ